MLITDQVATARCTDPIEERFRTFKAKPWSNTQILQQEVFFDALPVRLVWIQRSHFVRIRLAGHNWRRGVGHE